MSTLAYVAQWLEHWSCKPGVESSILSGGFQFFIFIFYLKWADSTNSTTQMTITGSVAQWLEHWSCKPGVESSILSRSFSLFFFTFLNRIYLNWKILINMTASVAQWLEHWSSKPGVESSIISRGFSFFFFFTSFNRYNLSMISAERSKCQPQPL